MPSTCPPPPPPTLRHMLLGFGKGEETPLGRNRWITSAPLLFVASGTVLTTETKNTGLLGETASSSASVNTSQINPACPESLLTVSWTLGIITGSPGLTLAVALLIPSTSSSLL